uniref:anti-sigma factor family protein n=1 Tax=Phaeobacter italicus TaxID=481446 RepID=UPI003A5C06AF
MHDRYFTDEELVAYLDGETDFAPVAEITAALAQDPALQARLAALEIDRAALAEGFADLQPEAGLRSVAGLSPGARHGGWSGQIAVPAPHGRVGLRSGLWG